MWFAGPPMFFLVHCQPQDPAQCDNVKVEVAEGRETPRANMEYMIPSPRVVPLQRRVGATCAMATNRVQSPHPLMSKRAQSPHPVVV